MSSLQKGEDLLAVLLSGFGKSMIFTESQRGRAAVHPVLVICPLNSIVSDKIPQMEGLCTGVELTDENISRVLGEYCQPCLFTVPPNKLSVGRTLSCRSQRPEWQTSPARLCNS